MTTYALIAGNTIVEKRDFAGTPPDVSRKGIKWLPIATTDPVYDPTTQVKSGPVYTILSNGVTEVYTVRNLTSDELDGIKATTVDAMDALAFRVLFNHENRIRALESKQAITAAQFKTALKALR